MKKFFGILTIILFFFVILLFPKQTLIGATDGLLLWFQILLPTLLPFLIMSNILIHTNAMTYVVRFFGPLLQRIFCVSANGSFAVLSGFLCGYPVGAKVTADLIKAKRISVNEGKYLLSFCNNTSPAFIVSYIVLQHLKDDSILLPTFVILYSSTVLCSVVFRKKYKMTFSSLYGDSPVNAPICFEFQIFDDCIMNAFETITKIGGYVILFSVLIQLCSILPFQLFLPYLEITNGIPMLVNAENSFCISYVSIMALTSFGGLCSLAQTNSMIQGTPLSITSYTIEKLVTTLVTSLLTLLYVTISLR